MAKRYIKVPFQNSPSTATPLSAAFLNPIINALDACDTEIENKFDKANIANNLITTAPGLALDARQGKALQDQITVQNDNLAGKTIYSGSITSEITVTTQSITGINHIDVNIYDGNFIIYSVTLRVPSVGQKVGFQGYQQATGAIDGYLVFDTLTSCTITITAGTITWANIYGYAI
jgi:hypothetical protein